MNVRLFLRILERSSVSSLWHTPEMQTECTLKRSGVAESAECARATLKGSTATVFQLKDADPGARRPTFDTCGLQSSGRVAHGQITNSGERILCVNHR